MIRRLLIANRGEIACASSAPAASWAVESVAVYSDADAAAPHVAAADRAVAIGPAPARRELPVDRRGCSRPRARPAPTPSIPATDSCPRTRRSPRACAGAGLVFVGPPADVIAQMGSKIDARRLVSAAGVPVVPGRNARTISRTRGTAAGGRARRPAGARSRPRPAAAAKACATSATPARSTPAIQAARREATAAFGDGTLYVERLIERPRHVEVQVFADDHGHVVHLFERECSVQRRHQKVIEESPSPALTPALRARMTDAAVAAARAAGYRNAGTIEFLVDGARRRRDGSISSR